MIYAIDSNIISYMLKHDTGVQKCFNNAINDNIPYSIPPLVYYEVKRGLTAIKANAKLKEFAKLYKNSVKGTMNKKVWDKAIEIYARLRPQGTLIDDADIFIASFCIVNDYILITNNTRHFSIIKELNTINWKE